MVLNHSFITPEGSKIETYKIYCTVKVKKQYTHVKNILKTSRRRRRLPCLWYTLSVTDWVIGSKQTRLTTHPGKSWNLRKEFSRSGKSWKMTVIM